MVNSPFTSSSPSPLRLIAADLKLRVGNFSASKKSALFRCASLCASPVLMDAASIVASIFELITSSSSRRKLPDTPVNWPFTFEIIMCLTLNSATECAASMFQLLTAACGAVSVVICIFLSGIIRFVKTRFVTTSIKDKKLRRGAGGTQQVAKSFQALPPEVAQLLAMGILHWFVEP